MTSRDELAQKWCLENGHHNWHYANADRTKIEEEPNDESIEAFKAGYQAAIEKLKQVRNYAGFTLDGFLAIEERAKEEGKE